MKITLGSNRRIKLIFVFLITTVGFLIIFDLFISNVYIKNFIALSPFREIQRRRELNATEEVYNLKKKNNNISNFSSYSLKGKCNAINKNVKQFQIKLDGVTYPNIVPLYHNRSINFTCLNSSNNIKTILMWTSFKGSPLQDYGFGVRTPFEKLNCPVTNCELTNDRNKFKQSELVLFHLRNKIDSIPERYDARQRYVHVIYESPVHCHMCDKYEDVFNLTASYREDSDFSSLYWTDSNLYWSDEPTVVSGLDDNAHVNKSGFAAILASNCESRSLREEYVKELSKYVRVDIYGKCGSFKCPNEGDCRKYLADKYKFFLAFENSLCYGYITEKLFDTLNYNVIPVVYGHANYSYYLPESGYINALDFKSPRHLAEYLLYLDKNKTAYYDYFSWRKYLKVDANKKIGGYLCEMCIKLNLEENLNQREYKQLKSAKKTYGLYENCLDVELYNVKYLNVSKLNRNIFSYFMSPER